MTHTVAFGDARAALARAEQLFNSNYEELRNPQRTEIAAQLAVAHAIAADLGIYQAEPQEPKAKPRWMP